MKRITKLVPKILYIVTLFTIMASMGFTGLYLAVGPDLPAVDTIRQIRLQTPMSVYSKDGQLINEFGDIRRIPITLDQVPQDFINALLSTEDVRFYQHSGVDFKGVMRAIFKLASTGTKSQGASTITMLVARNYYLTREKRFSRKFTEMFVAWKLESELTKTEILELFLNKIPFGHRSAGLGAASQVYYGKKLNQLSLPQLATLAGIPNGPSIFNPISKPELAKKRRAHVLGRMLAEGHINNQQFQEATNQPIKTTRHGAKITVNAPYIAEMVHMDLIRRYGRDAAHSDGLKVYTSLNPILQDYAQQALRSSLLEYDRRHGFRPVEQHYDIDESIEEADMLNWIGDFSQIGELLPALVVTTNKEDAEILLADGSHGKVQLKNSLWARKYVDENNRVFGKITDISNIVVVGDVIRVFATDEFETIKKMEPEAHEISPGNEKSANIESQTKESELTTKGLPLFLLSQIPDVNGGFVALNPQNGALEALVGGFNFRKSQFNMVTQARRQLGSNIKPFIYSSALNKGYTAASLINDSPIIDWDPSAGAFWRPENDSEIYRGPMRLREALRRSINTVSVRLIRKIGPRYAKQYLQDIGFPGKHMQPFPSLALGSASFTPLEVATGYATLANGGYKINPWYVERIEDSHGQILFEQQPLQVCEECLITLEEHAQKTLTENLEAEKLLEKLVSENQEPQSGDQLTTNALKPPLSDEEALRQELLTIDAEKTIHNIPLLTVAENKIAPRVIDARNRYIVDSMLKDVIHRGTAWRTLNNAKSPLLKRQDIAGKTGTTNDSKDAWFSGYNRNYVASAWVGFRDHSKKLGKKEFGAKAALPIWRRFMEKALRDKKQDNFPRPEGMVDVKIDILNGKLASINTERSEFEVFRIEHAPTEYSEPPLNINIIDEIDVIDKTEDEELDDENADDEIDFG